MECDASTPCPNGFPGLADEGWLPLEKDGSCLSQVEELRKIGESGSRGRQYQSDTECLQAKDGIGRHRLPTCPNEREHGHRGPSVDQGWSLQGFDREPGNRREHARDKSVGAVMLALGKRETKLKALGSFSGFIFGLIH